MSKRRVLIAVVAALAVTAGGVGAASSSAADGGGGDGGGRGGRDMRASLTGYEEVPSISTPATGSFSARRVSNGVFEYTLTFSGLEAPTTQAHIHFGQPAVSGGISVWLCSNLPSPPTPAGVQPCPASGTVTGTINAASVVGPAGQGIDAGQIDELLAAVDNGLAYCNIHTQKYQPGEIRGQIREGRGRG